VTKATRRSVMVILGALHRLSLSRPGLSEAWANRESTCFAARLCTRASRHAHVGREGKPQPRSSPVLLICPDAIVMQRRSAPSLPQAVCRCFSSRRARFAQEWVEDRAAFRPALEPGLCESVDRACGFKISFKPDLFRQSPGLSLDLSHEVVEHATVRHRLLQAGRPTWQSRASSSLEFFGSSSNLA